MNAAPRDQAMDEFIPTRNSLLSRMRDSDDYEGWREFFDTYWRFLYGIALRCGLSNEDARDVVQETVLAAAKGLREGRFHRAGRGSFKNWLELIVRRRVNDHLRRARVRPPSQADHPGFWPGRPHGGGANLLFVDGHVESGRQTNWLSVGTRHRWDNDGQPHPETWGRE